MLSVEIRAKFLMRIIFLCGFSCLIEICFALLFDHNTRQFYFYVCNTSDRENPKKSATQELSVAPVPFILVYVFSVEERHVLVGKFSVFSKLDMHPGCRVLRDHSHSLV